MLFQNRTEAGRALADAVATALGRAAPDERRLVLGLPRGGVPVAAPVADALDADLDVLVVRKLGAPGHEEYAMGAIASGGIRVLNEKAVHDLGVTPAQLERIEQGEQHELARREHRLRGGRRPIPVEGRTVVLVDDGIATGSTMEAAIRAVREGGASQVVVAVPLAPEDTLTRLDPLADEVICLSVPSPFYAVGQGYRAFPQVSDEEVAAILAPSPV
jgi:predicted phosphoribosyltransferase